MVFKCCVVNCGSNYAGEEKQTAFSFPKEEHLRKIWIKLVNKKDLEPSNLSFICIKHFEDKYSGAQLGGERLPLPFFENQKKCSDFVKKVLIVSIFVLNFPFKM